MPKLEDYKLVYEGELDNDDQVSEIYDLDTIYERFQGVKPEGYKGTSISVSDVVFIYGKYFYCDSIGWKEVTFQTEEEEKGEEHTVTLSEQFLHFAKNGDILNGTIKVGEWKVDRIWERQGGRRDKSGNLTVENMWYARLIGDSANYLGYTRKELKRTISGNKVTVRIAIPKKNEEAKMIDLEENGNRCAGETPEMKARIAEAHRMKRYQELANNHPGAMLLFSCGDFYETYYGDAITAAKVLGITLVKRPGFGKEEGHELAGFPHHALDIYLPKLIRAGLRVAIVDE